MSIERDPKTVIQELSMLGLALAEVQAATNRNVTMAFIGRAILAAEAHGIEPLLLQEIYQKTFPEEPLPTKENFKQLIKKLS